MVSHPASTVQFLESLFHPDDWIELRGIIRYWDPDGIDKLLDRGWFRLPEFSNEELIEKLRKRNAEDGVSIYFGVCPRAEFEKGKKEDVRLIRNLWCDFDGIDLDGVLSKLGDLQPSIAVNSGNGVHAYWRLAEPITGKAMLERTERVIQGMQVAFGGDSTQDRSRLLRLPGFFNTKEFYRDETMVPCEVELFEPDRIYELRDFDTFLQLVPSKASRKPRKKRQPKPVTRETYKRQVASGDLPERLEDWTTLLTYVDEDDDRSQIDYRFCHWCASKGLSDEQAWEHCEGLSKFGDRGIDYFDETMSKARSNYEDFKRTFKRRKGLGTMPEFSKNTDTNDQPDEVLDDTATIRYEDCDVTTGDKITVKESEFLMYPHVPKGVITIIEGRQGQAKSTTSQEIAIRAVIEAPMPPEPLVTKGAEPKHKVIIMSGEEDYGRVTKPRLILMGATSKILSHIHFVSGFKADRKIASKFAFRHVGLLVRKLRPVLVIVDPIDEYMDDGTSINNPHEVRSQLGELGELGRIYGTSFMVTRHLGKDISGKQHDPGLGSGAIRGLARSVIQFHRSGPDFYMEHTKGSETGEADYCLHYTIESRQRVIGGIDHTKGVPVWIGEEPLSNLPTDDAAARRRQAKQEFNNPGKRALGFANTALKHADDSGVAHFRDLRSAMRTKGIVDNYEQLIENRLTPIQNFGFGAVDLEAKTVMLNRSVIENWEKSNGEE